MMQAKVTIGSLEDFQAREGEELFASPPLTVTKEMIQQFCRSVNQLDWFHFDEERCADSSFGAIVAPGMFTLSLIHSVYFENVELKGLRALFLGSDRFRILRPVKAGDELSLKFFVNRVQLRDEGFAVHYDFSWHCNGEEQPVTLGDFIVRYWPENN
ncbi:MAG: MaoC/PaaZ C-terminal domain-containing protein [Halioglobus sp.]